MLFEGPLTQWATPQLSCSNKNTIWASQTVSFCFLVFFYATYSLSCPLIFNQINLFPAPYVFIILFCSREREKSIKTTEKNFERKKTVINGIPTLVIVNNLHFCLSVHPCHPLYWLSLSTNSNWKFFAWLSRSQKSGFLSLNLSFSKLLPNYEFFPLVSLVCPLFRSQTTLIL